jgi:hypothetical protein
VVVAKLSFGHCPAIQCEGPGGPATQGTASQPDARLNRGQSRLVSRLREKTGYGSRGWRMFCWPYSHPAGAARGRGARGIIGRCPSHQRCREVFHGWPI